MKTIEWKRNREQQNIVDKINDMNKKNGKKEWSSSEKDENDNEYSLCLVFRLKIEASVCVFNIMCARCLSLSFDLSMFY